MITIQNFVFNPFSVNTWLVHDQNGQSILVDPACHNFEEQDRLAGYCVTKNLKVCAILNTHGHFDHTCGLKWAHEKFNCRFYAHEKDKVFLEFAREQAKAFGFELAQDPPPIDQYLRDGEKLQFGDLDIEIRHAPGHSPGSVVFYLKDAKAVITGDVLFQGSIGRTDLPGGDHDQLLNSIQTKLLVLEDQTRVLPGHGPESTIIAEKLTNPFLRWLS